MKTILGDCTFDNDICFRNKSGNIKKLLFEANKMKIPRKIVDKKIE